MIRPMCGSSSATSTWSRPAGSGTWSDERRDVRAVPPRLEQQLTQIRGGLGENEEDRVGVQDAHHRDAVSVLEDRGLQRAASVVRAEFVAGGHDLGDEGRQALRVDRGLYVTVDQQAIAAENDGGLDPFALAEDADEVT